MVGSSTAVISSIVRTPRRSISSTTRSLWTTCPRIAPRPPPAANRFTFRSAIRTPEQKPYLAARLTFIGGRERNERAGHSGLECLDPLRRYRIESRHARIAQDRFVARDEPMILSDRLGDEKPVKGIA